MWKPQKINANILNTSQRPDGITVPNVWDSEGRDYQFLFLKDSIILNTMWHLDWILKQRQDINGQSGEI